MNKKSYFNFPAFRAGLYDTELSVNARLVYMHLVQYSSDSRSNGVFNITEPQIAEKLGFITSSGNLAVKTVQRALKELNDAGYLKKWQKFKGTGVPLTISMNFNDEFLKAKLDKNKQKLIQTGDVDEQHCEQKPSSFVQPILSIPIPYYPFQSETIHSYPVQSEPIGDENLEEEFCKKVVPEKETDADKAKEFIREELGTVQDFTQLSSTGTLLRNYVRNDCEIPGLEEYLNNAIQETVSSIKTFR